MFILLLYLYITIQLNNMNTGKYRELCNKYIRDLKNERKLSDSLAEKIIVLERKIHYELINESNNSKSQTIITHKNLFPEINKTSAYLPRKAPSKVEIPKSMKNGIIDINNLHKTNHSKMNAIKTSLITINRKSKDGSTNKVSKIVPEEMNIGNVLSTFETSLSKEKTIHSNKQTTIYANKHSLKQTPFRKTILSCSMLVKKSSRNNGMNSGECKVQEEDISCRKQDHEVLPPIGEKTKVQRIEHIVTMEKRSIPRFSKGK